jgi:hypothetical protein
LRLASNRFHSTRYRYFRTSSGHSTHAFEYPLVPLQDTLDVRIARDREIRRQELAAILAERKRRPPKQNISVEFDPRKFQENDVPFHSDDSVSCGSKRSNISHYPASKRHKTIRFATAQMMNVPLLPSDRFSTGANLDPDPPAADVAMIAPFVDPSAPPTGSGADRRGTEGSGSATPVSALVASPGANTAANGGAPLLPPPTGSGADRLGTEGSGSASSAVPPSISDPAQMMNVGACLDLAPPAADDSGVVQRCNAAAHPNAMASSAANGNGAAKRKRPNTKTTTLCRQGTWLR